MRKDYFKPVTSLVDLLPENRLCTLSNVALLSTSEAFLPDEDGVTFF